MRLILACLLTLAACDKLRDAAVPPDAAPDPAALRNEAERKLITDAKDMCEKGKCHDAHLQLGGLPVDSPLRHSPDFIATENKWARTQIDQAKKEGDISKRIALLEEVSRATTIDGTLRNEAVDVINANTVAPAPSGSAAETPLQRATKLSQSGDTKGARGVLEPRVFANQATKEEIELLRTLCKTDRACLAKLAKAKPSSS